jgi:hypothetical protein
MSYLNELKASNSIPPNALVIAAQSFFVQGVQDLIQEFGCRDESYSALKATSWFPTDEKDVEDIKILVNIARLLLNSRDDCNLEDIHLVDTLCEFSRVANLELMALVLDYGVDANAVGSSGATPFLVSCGSWSTHSSFTLAAMQLLLDRGADVHSRVQLGKTVFFYIT